MANEKVFKIKIDGISQAIDKASNLVKILDQLDDKEKTTRDLNLTTSEKNLINLNKESKTLIENFETLTIKAEKFNAEITKFSDLINDSKSLFTILSLNFGISDENIKIIKNISETIAQNAQLTEKAIQLSEKTKKLSNLLVASQNKYLVTFENNQKRSFTFGSDGGATFSFSVQTGQQTEIEGYSISLTKDSIYPLFEIDMSEVSKSPIWILNDGVWNEESVWIRDGIWKTI